MTVGRAELESHLRSIMADLELRIHRKLLERLDLYEFETNRPSDTNSVLLLENNIEDVCRDVKVFSKENEPLLEEITGLTLRDHLVNQLIMEKGNEEYFDLASLTSNEFDVPATLVPEREAELHGLLMFVRERLCLQECRDVSEQIHRVEDRFGDIFHLVRPHLHAELRKYLILRTLKKDIKDTIFGFGPLQDLLRAPTVTEIMVVGRDQIYVERAGVIEKSGRRFISDKVTESIIERIVAQVGRRIDKSQPLVDARLPDGSRVNAIIPPLAVKGPCLTVRKFPLQRLTMDDLIEMGSISRSAATFLRACVIDRRNVLVSGGTGTGKTTMLNVLSSFIPFKERIITIEDTMELRLHQEHVVSLETKPANVEGTGQYTIRDLVKNALRMRPDRVIVGECRSGEALDMVQAMNTGHDGSMTTVHANQRLRGRRAAGSADPHGGRSPGDVHPPPVVHRAGLDRTHQPHARRTPRGDADFRSCPLRSRRETDRRIGHFQLSQWGVAAADRLPSDVHQFAGGEGSAGVRLPARTGSPPARARGPVAGADEPENPLEAVMDAVLNGPMAPMAWLACACFAAAVGSAAFFCRDYFAWGFNWVEADIAEKLRRLAPRRGTSAAT